MHGKSSKILTFWDILLKDRVEIFSKPSALAATYTPLQSLHVSSDICNCKTAIHKGELHTLHKE